MDSIPTEQPIQEDPEAIRAALFAALSQQDSQTFARLCQKHWNTIVENFQYWARLPESVRDDPQATNFWVQALINIAQYFQSQGQPELMYILAGDTADNPVVRWQDGLAEAQQLYEEGHYATSNDLLLRMLKEMEGATGSAIDNLHSKMYGSLGVNFFRLGDLEHAQHYTELALKECQRTGDQAGIEIYRENLQSVQAAFDERSGGRMVQVRTTIAQAQDLSDALNYQASNQLLKDLLKQHQADVLQDYLPKIYGLLGSNYFHLGEMVRAQENTELALQISRRNDDRAGVRVYQTNLEIISQEIEGQP